MSHSPVHFYQLLSETLKICTFDREKHAGHIQIMTDCWIKWAIENDILEFEP